MDTLTVGSSLQASLFDANNNSDAPKRRNTGKSGSKNYEKYSLRPRSIQVRIETEKRKDRKKEPKPKQKPPPLSKYRRKNANARERTRMKELNSAFDALQKCMPNQYPPLPVNANGRTCEKLTKITTLRQAMSYIDSLKSLLHGSSIATPTHEDDFAIGSSSSSISHYSSSSDFSPSSSYTMSPVSSPPECIQTVMRGVVSPSFALSPSSSSCSVASPGSCSSSSSTSSSASCSPYPPSSNIILLPKYQHQQSHHQFHQLQTLTNVDPSVKNSSYHYNMMQEYLPAPILNTTTASSYSMQTQVQFFPNRIHQSVGSLNESDFGEYASDLLSDSGDDPIFEDIMGVAADFPELLLETDGDTLRFTTDMPVPGT